MPPDITPAPTALDLESEADWAKTPEYDSRAFWRLVLRQASRTDDANRELLVIGLGVSGPIRCTREYGQNRLALVGGRRR